MVYYFILISKNYFRNNNKTALRNYAVWCVLLWTDRDRQMFCVPSLRQHDAMRATARAWQPTTAAEQPATAVATKQLSPAAPAFRPAFRAAAAHAATSAACCARLHGGGRASAAAVLMPWLGFGTYKLGASQARQAVLAALYAGYRMIDTAYIYSNEKTEAEVGEALSQAMAEGVVERADVFVTTKHWRKYHGFEPALGCLQRSLERLQLEFVDCWMMHWPGPAWEREARSRPGRRCSKVRGANSQDLLDEPAAHGLWHYAADGHGRELMAALRAETWRAMEHALREGKARLDPE